MKLVMIHTFLLPDQLTVIDDEQFGDYECKAENDLGTLQRVIVLEKGKKPPTPEFKVYYKLYKGIRPCVKK